MESVVLAGKGRGMDGSTYLGAWGKVAVAVVMAYISSCKEVNHGWLRVWYEVARANDVQMYRSGE